MNDRRFDSSPRNVLGVKLRRDGSGDGWAERHRSELGNDFLMQDVDACFGTVVFGHNTGERLFLEYVPDSYENRMKSVRDFALVAMFDRKASELSAFSNVNMVSRAFYSWQCRVFAGVQPRAPKMFYVVGSQSPPWEMIEIDIVSAERTGRRYTIRDTTDWTMVWTATGLVGVRNELSAWLQR